MADNYLIGNVSGDIAHFRTALEEPLESCKVSFEPVQVGSGDPSPSNVRAISGWNEINIYSTGINVWDETLVTGSIIEDGSIGGASSRRTTSFIPVKGGLKYYFNTPSSAAYGRIAYYDKDKNPIYVDISNGIGRGSFTAKDGACYMRITLGYQYGTTYNHDISFNYPSSDTSYHSYKGIISTVLLEEDETLYGGYVDLATGELVETWHSMTLAEIGAIDLGYNSGGYFFATISDRFGTYKKKIGTANIKCNVYKYENASSPSVFTDYSMRGTGGSGAIFWKDSRYTTVSSLVSNEGNNIIFCWELDTPIHYQLTPQQINTFKGINNFWSTAGTIDVSYCFKDAPEMLKLRRQIELSSPHVETATGTTASFKTDMMAPLKECKISFSPTQEGSGDPSPTNVRPIKGLNRLDVRHTSKNIVPLDGWTAANGNDYGSRSIKNSYGTTLSTMDNSGTVTVTQSQYSESSDPTNYKNGYFCLISESLEFGKRYNVSFDVTDITNPLNVPLETIRLLSPSGGGSVIGGSVVYSNNRYVCRGYLHNKYTSTPNRNIDRIEIRNCGMSFTVSNVLITPLDDTNVEYEDYQGESFIIDSPLEGKNIADVYGVSATNFTTIYMKPASLNNYGTTISVNGDSIVVTQSQAPNTSNKNSYQNGYFSIGVNGLKFGEMYNVSFKITDIVSNPLDAQLSDILVYGPSGGGNRGYTVDGNRVSQKIQYSMYQNTNTHRHYFEIRNCGMSFTLSEFMVTVESETDQTYEPYKKTMYGGYIDLVNKEFVQEWECVKMEPSWDWNRYEPYATTSSNHFVQFYANTLPLSIYGEHDRTVYSNMFKSVLNINDRERVENNMSVYRSQYAYCFRYDEIETVEDWVAFITANDVYACGKLVTPIHHSLTADTLRSFRGNNRIWSGDCNVETRYWSHIKENKIQITWNQLSRELNTSNWNIYNANYGTLTFENGIAKVTVTQDTPNQYMTGMCSTNSAVVNWDENHLYYLRQEIRSSDDHAYVNLFSAMWRSTLLCKANEWTELKAIDKPSTTTRGSLWINYPATNCSTGQTHECRRVNLIDLTLMFGAGNEPTTVEEFEQICMKNGVDLTQAQPYDAGTPLTWIV